MRLAGIGIGKIVERHPQLAHSHLPQGQQGIVVANGFAPEAVETPGRGNVGTLTPWMAQIEANTALTRIEAMDRKLPHLPCLLRVVRPRRCG